MSDQINTSFLPLMEEYYTIQGEGFNAGKAAHFLRLGGCDVGCTWCDVKDSWVAGNHPMVNISEMLNIVKKQNAETIVVTGGEPLMYNLDELTKLFKLNKIETYLETSGAYSLSGSWDWICVSPKKFKKPLHEVLLFANELKVVIYNKSDFKWAEENAINTPENCYLYLQPEWSKMEQNMPMIIEYVKNNPRWKISVQIHKFMNIP